MTARLAHIFRHPIKSVGYEEITGASLTEGRAFPLDREWALLHARSGVTRMPDGRASDWAGKIHFVIGRTAPPLMQVRAQVQPDGRLRLRLRLSHPARDPLEIDPDTPEDHPRLVAWLGAFWPETQPRPTALVRAPDRPLSDEPLPYISLIGQSSLDDLSKRAGQPLDRRRFRANLWVTGWEPFAEFDLIGKTLRIGEAEVQLRARIERCRATDTNIETGARDIDMLSMLDRAYGHSDLGVFGLVTRSGRIGLDDPVEVI